MTATMTEIRQVQSQDDIAEVAALAREIWTQHYVPIIGQAQVDYMLGRFQSKQAIADQVADTADYFLVLAGDRPVGYFAVIPDPGTGRMMLSKIYVRESERGNGFGKAALRRAEDLCRTRGLGTLWLSVNRHNDASIRWYTRMGFRNAGPRVTDIGNGFVMDDFVMEKTISNDAV